MLVSKIRCLLAKCWCVHVTKSISYTPWLCMYPKYYKFAFLRMIYKKGMNSLTLHVPQWIHNLSEFLPPNQWEDCLRLYKAPMSNSFSQIYYSSLRFILFLTNLITFHHKNTRHYTKAVQNFASIHFFSQILH